MPVRGVIFDLDGTLVDTNAAHAEAWRRAFADQGYDVPLDRIRPEIGKGGDKLLPAVIGDAATKKNGEALKKGNGDHYKQLAGGQTFPVLPGAEALLAELRRRGVKTALATSSKPKHLEPTFASCGVDFTKLVDESADAGDAEQSKPAPDLVHAALDKLGLPAADCAMVGDTLFDGEAAGKAGVRFWAVACGGTTDEAALKAAGAARVFRDPAELLARLDEVLG
jgi:HAD superfamily hydrolase (TIGR01509 family)